ncbi:enoyl-CoA hydratase/isomerase family protein [Neoroseomonas oryzicola]|uniref:3-hydroxyisobutyryl-CoA hydrolase n=1 Tax=Neoroseomonas oryzicola TaxID=535904 RepID=A0A9X9WEG2_9PROT|nr:enoyl-CoA hydratase/isomerase family protein [Neoroseomonas oryzicola]MBR0658722.1 enoyl-CoA hydratase/isomerase family protein [Neoroseomonas oryzicola]NKE17842.1 enoyl-CoA hydratase/isomerase family protein [Neoroseomonas oryzicola]
MSETAEPSLVVTKEGVAGTLLMNRPKALNALDQAMIRAFSAAIAAWRDDAAVKLVVLEGAGGRAFCAGGDVRALRTAAMAGDRATVEAFFSEEYEVNAGIASFPKPWVSLIDGVCMGGGIGVSVHQGPQVVTEHALIAMPETAIALFPDVGTSYVLPRLPGAVGTWLALTGARLTGADAVHAGLATHFVPRERLHDLRAALVAEGVDALARFAVTPPEASFAPHREAIDRCFGQDSVPAILAALDAEGTEWAAAQAKILRRMSPTSMCVSLELLRRGAKEDLAGCLAMELALTRVVVHEHPDFVEGVRSVLVDKDGAPKWQPARVEDVDPAAIARMFGGR